MGLLKFKSPSLPMPRPEYSQDQFSQFMRALENYFFKVDNAYWDGVKVVNPYGAWESNVSQTATVNTATVMQLEVVDYENAMNIAANTKMTVSYSGIYNLQWSGQFRNTDNAQHDIYVWLRKNGTDVTGSTGVISIPARKSASPGDEGHLIAGWNYFIQLEANDYVELWWSTENALVTLHYFPTSGTPTKPSTASLIATLSFVSALP